MDNALGSIPIELGHLSYSGNHLEMIELFFKVDEDRNMSVGLAKLPTTWFPV